MNTTKPSFPPTSVIILINRSNQTYRLNIPFFDFKWKFPILGNRNQYSIQIPYSPQGSIKGILTNVSTGRKFSFVISRNGDIDFADAGLAIGTVASDLYLHNLGLLPGVDTINNNLLTIKESLFETTSTIPIIIQ